MLSVDLDTSAKRDKTPSCEQKMQVIVSDDKVISMCVGTALIFVINPITFKSLMHDFTCCDCRKEQPMTQAIQ